MFEEGIRKVFRDPHLREVQVGIPGQCWVQSNEVSLVSMRCKSTRRRSAKCLPYSSQKVLKKVMIQKYCRLRDPLVLAIQIQVIVYMCFSLRGCFDPKCVSSYM